MSRRVVPLLIALAVACAPVALEACHIVCASLAPEADGRAATHNHAGHSASCHEAPASQAPFSLHASTCDHGDDLPTTAGIASARQSKIGVLAFDEAPAARNVVGSYAEAAMPAGTQPADPAAIHLAVPLRI